MYFYYQPVEAAVELSKSGWEIYHPPIMMKTQFFTTIVHFLYALHFHFFFTLISSVERRRRDKINNWIVTLSKIIPDCSMDSTKTGAVSSLKHSARLTDIFGFKCLSFQLFCLFRAKAAFCPKHVTTSESSGKATSGCKRV